MQPYSILYVYNVCLALFHQPALLAQLGERQTEDLKVLCSIHRQSIFLHFVSQISQSTFTLECNFI